MVEKPGAKIYGLKEAAARLRQKQDAEREPKQESAMPDKGGQLLKLEISETCPCALCRLEKDEIKPLSVTEKIDAMEPALPDDTNGSKDEATKEKLKKHLGKKSLTELADIILRLEIEHATTHPDYCIQLFAEYYRKAGWAAMDHERFLEKQR